MVFGSPVGGSQPPGSLVRKNAPAQGGYSFMQLGSLTGKQTMSPAGNPNPTKTINPYTVELAISPKFQPREIVEDIYAATSGFSSEVASALNHLPTLMVEDARGQRSSASNYLNAAELKLLSQLPESFRNRLLNVDSAQPAEHVRIQMRTQLKEIIGQLVQSGHVSFKSRDGSQWELESLLSLANAIQRLPLAQRKQLDGVTFMRAPQPATPAGIKPALLDQIAMNTIAGQYDKNAKVVSLYDRGARDGFPELSSGLRQSLRTIQNRGYSEDIRQLQRMLNPYLVRINQPEIKDDGNWGSGTAKAIRQVQLDLLGRHAQSKGPLTPAQQAELNSLKALASSPQFDLILQMTDVQAKMANLNLLPDPHFKQLLQEFTRSEFGEASLKFLMQDISNDFRTTPSVSRVEEIMTHEMGHHFQLGHSNESHYISEFGKLSHWRENETGEQADGYIGGQYTAEDIKDVYHVLACDCKQDKGFYRPDLSPQERSQKFVSDYAATDPMEDFAESYKDFVLNPYKLFKTSPEKFFFINALPAIQARKTGVGAKEASHYQPKDIEAMVDRLLGERFPNMRQNGHIPRESISAYIRQQFEGMMDLNLTNRKLNLNPEVMLAIVETHKRLLENANMTYIPTSYMHKTSSNDEEVFRQMHEQTRQLLASRGQDKGAQEFFKRFEKPAEIDRLFPRASAELREQLKDPAFSSMMLALGKIGGHAFYINQLQNKDSQQLQNYQEAKGFFNRVLDEPSSMLSTQALSYSWNYMRGLSSEVFNPEESKISSALDFFQQLEKNPEKVMPDVWNRLPADFQDLLRNRRFIMAVSGDYGRYLPSTESTRQVLEQVMDMLEFQRSLNPD